MITYSLNLKTVSPHLDKDSSSTRNAARRRCLWGEIFVRAGTVAHLHQSGEYAAEMGSIATLRCHLGAQNVPLQPPRSP